MIQEEKEKYWREGRRYAEFIMCSNLFKRYGSSFKDEKEFLCKFICGYVENDICMATINDEGKGSNIIECDDCGGRHLLDDEEPFLDVFEGKEFYASEMF